MLGSGKMHAHIRFVNPRVGIHTGWGKEGEAHEEPPPPCQPRLFCPRPPGTRMRELGKGKAPGLRGKEVWDVAGCTGAWLGQQLLGLAVDMVAEQGEPAELRTQQRAKKATRRAARWRRFRAPPLASTSDQLSDFLLQWRHL